MSERTDGEVLSEQPVEVMLAGRSFGIAPITPRKCRSFYAACSGVLEGLQTAEGALREISVENLGADVTAALPILRAFLSTIGPGAIDLLYEYSDEIGAARDHIEEHATLEECLDALLVCMRLAFGPFVRLPGKIAGMQGHGNK